MSIQTCVPLIETIRLVATSFTDSGDSHALRPTPSKGGLFSQTAKVGDISIYSGTPKGSAINDKWVFANTRYEYDNLMGLMQNHPLLHEALSHKRVIEEKCAAHRLRLRDDLRTFVIGTLDIDTTHEYIIYLGAFSRVSTPVAYNCFVEAADSIGLYGICPRIVLFDDVDNVNVRRIMGHYVSQDVVAVSQEVEYVALMWNPVTDEKESGWHHLASILSKSVQTSMTESQKNHRKNRTAEEPDLKISDSLALNIECGTHESVSHPMVCPTNADALSVQDAAEGRLAREADAYDNEPLFLRSRVKNKFFSPSRPAYSDVQHLIDSLSPKKP